MEKFNRRLVKVTKQHGEEARQLLKLMGVPVVEAPCEAEAQCAALVRYFYYQMLITHLFLKFRNN